jgi:hypothetical protein
MADVFISYKRSERSRVELIEKSLRDEDLSVWFDAGLELGRGEGFDAEIEREVTSAASVVVCWTPEALSSVYVKAEAKKGLEREVLVPVFLQQCSLPIPFNAVDTADLSRWQGDRKDPNWRRVVDKLNQLKDSAKRNQEAIMARSAAAYNGVKDQIFPGTLSVLVRRIAAMHDLDADKYHRDIDALLSWFEAIYEKEANYVAEGYELAERQSGGSAWRYWNDGKAEERGAKIEGMIIRLEKLKEVMRKSERFLNFPTP